MLLRTRWTLENELVVVEPTAFEDSHYRTPFRLRFSVGLPPSLPLTALLFALRLLVIEPRQAGQ